MKVLVVSSKYHPEYSGSGFRAHNMHKRFRSKFATDFDVVASSLEACGVKRYTYEHVDVVRISGVVTIVKFKGVLQKVAIWFNFPFEIFRCWKFIHGRIDRYDVLHTFGNSWSVGFFTWYFARHNKSVIRELCNDIPSPYYPKRFEKLIRPVFQKDNAIMVAISPLLERMALSYGVKHIWQRPNPIEEEKFYPRSKGERARLRFELTKFRSDDIVMVSVANFSQRKNQIFLLKVLSLLPSRYKLVLAGVMHNDIEGGRRGRGVMSSIKYVQTIQEFIDRHGLKDRVQISTGFVKNPQEYMALSDIYLFPSIHEGLGTPILESQACGIPIVANYLPGITDVWIKNNIGGYVCELDAKLWSTAIVKVLEIQSSILHMNSNYILSKAGSRVIDQKYIDIFRELST